MYYSHSSRNPNATKNQQTILLLALLALTIVCVGLGIVYSGASSANNNMRRVLVAQIQIEASSAKTRAAQLLPTGGSRSESRVAMVRQHVHAVHVINEMAGKLYGRGNELITATYINRCVTLLDECDQKIQIGHVVTDTYDELNRAVDELLKQVEALTR